jgi:hypothetical protein
MNDSREYEKLTQEIYQDLLKNEGLTVDVKHNIKLQGKATEHQIDVFWEYTFAGVKHRVAIECKNYNKELSIGTVRDFHSVLTDIGNIHGVIVTKIGFQKGAKKFAEHYGLNLIIIREPNNEDWKGRIKSIQTDIHVLEINAKKWFVQLDYEWCKQNLALERVESIEVSLSGMNNEIWIYDDKGNKLKNFLQLQDQLPCDENSLLNNKHSYEFENAFIKSKEDGSIKIKGIHVLYDIIVDKFKSVLDSQKITKAIFKNVLTGEMKFIKTDFI